ncbi:MAG: hypothetical protein IKP71_03295 [Candidatus Riflebacteria bacterium]|nr:hypothetical protein [Candidatus Riflebacteria bacterium]
MKLKIIFFSILFAVIWIMHKPFDIHNTKFKRLHEWLEHILIIQGVIILNDLFNSVKEQKE